MLLETIRKDKKFIFFSPDGDEPPPRVSEWQDDWNEPHSDQGDKLQKMTGIKILVPRSSGYRNYQTSPRSALKET